MPLHLPSGTTVLHASGTVTPPDASRSPAPAGLRLPDAAADFRGASHEHSRRLLVMWNVRKAWRSGSRHIPSPQYVLRGCSLALDEGEQLLVAAERGAGATTLLLVAAGIARPDSGFVAGPWREGAGFVRFVPTTPAMPSSWTPRDAATAGAGSRWPAAAAVTAVERALRFNGIAEVADVELRRLPVAAAWRASAAAAHLSGARLILMDREPDDAVLLPAQIQPLAVAEPVVFGSAVLRVVPPDSHIRQDTCTLHLRNGELVSRKRG